jgi:hypothetical protein
MELGVTDGVPNIYQNACTSMRTQLWQFVLTEQDQANNGAYFTYELRPAHAHPMCMTVAGGLLDAGVNVEDDACVSDLHQYWLLKDVPNSDYFQLVNNHSRMCLDLSRGAGGGMGNVRQNPCDAAASQQHWFPNYVGDGLFELISEKTGRCIDVSEGSAAEHANIQEWDCVGVPQQYWQMIVTSF